MENFEKASRLKLRFETSQGSLSSEDLWELSLQSLDVVAKKTNKQLLGETEESFIPNKATRKTSTHNDLRLEILKHIIDVKVQEQDDRKNRNEKLNRLARLKELAADKADEQFKAQSLEDIQKQIDALEVEESEAALV